MTATALPNEVLVSFVAPNSAGNCIQIRGGILPAESNQAQRPAAPSG